MGQPLPSQHLTIRTCSLYNGLAEQVDYVPLVQEINKAVVQTYYKLSYVDRRIDNPEQRICEDVPYLASGLGDLLREWYTPLLPPPSFFFPESSLCANSRSA